MAVEGYVGFQVIFSLVDADRPWPHIASRKRRVSLWRRAAARKLTPSMSNRRSDS
ncbi:MAG: hypothetical protein ACM32F_13660 [Betaproteobacteria bacterium]